jgi:hypothetical protein
MLLIGSCAARAQFPSFREPHDIDFVCTEEQMHKYVKKNEEIGNIVDGLEPKSIDHWACKITSGISLLKWVEFGIAKDGNSSERILQRCGTTSFAPVDVLMMIKKSHLYWQLNFDKHIKDYHFFKSKGVVLDDELKDILKQRIKETEVRVGKPMTPSLKQTKDAFFGQSAKRVTYYFDHDNIHQVMAHKEKPMYTYMQKEEDEVFCTKAMWETFSIKDRVQCVQEEAYVIAIERKILPMLFGGGSPWSAINAYKWSVMRVCTSLSSGWFREAAIELWQEIMDAYNPEYVTKFLTAVDSGSIKKVKE